MKSIAFSSLMIKQIRYGHKTETRRLVKNIDPDFILPNGALMTDCYAEISSTWRGEGLYIWMDHEDGSQFLPLPFRAGDLMRVKERYRIDDDKTIYHADHDSDPNDKHFKERWRSPGSMPANRSRIILMVNGVDVEALQDIDEESAIREGFRFDDPGIDPITALRDYWNRIYRDHPRYQWDKNPLVWVIKFEVKVFVVGSHNV